MKILLVKVRQGKFDNLALLKLIRWCKVHGFEYKTVQEIEPADNFEPDIIFISLIFSYHWSKYKKIIEHYHSVFPASLIKVGGPFSTFNHDFLKSEYPYLSIHQGQYDEIENLIPCYEGLETIFLHSTKGCNRGCSYCSVGDMEGKFHINHQFEQTINQAFDETIPNKIVLYDSNFTSLSFKDFEKHILILKNTNLPVDIHGLHASQLTERKAKLLSTIPFAGQNTSNSRYIRFSFDEVQDYVYLKKATRLCVEYGINANIFAYMLYNYNDRPMDFFKRLKLAAHIGETYDTNIFLFPQRYIPLDSLNSNSYIGPYWTNEELKAYLKMVRWFHNFMAVGRSNTVFELLGNTQEMFHKRIMDKHKQKGWYDLRN